MEQDHGAGVGPGLEGGDVGQRRLEQVEAVDEGQVERGVAEHVGAVVVGEEGLAGGGHDPPARAPARPTSGPGAGSTPTAMVPGRVRPRLWPSATPIST